MKLRIIRPSQYIRYTDNELVPAKRKRNEVYALFAQQNPEHILWMAQPVWNEAFVK